MDRTTANRTLDDINRTIRHGEPLTDAAQASRRELAEAGYPTKVSSHTGYIVPLITRGLRWGEPDNA